MMYHTTTAEFLQCHVIERCRGAWWSQTLMNMSCHGKQWTF